MVKRKKQVGIYDELNELYKRATDVMVEATGPLQLYVQGGYAKDAGEDTARVDRMASMLARDVKHFSTQLTNLHAQHRDRTGKSRGIGQHFDAFTLGNDYIAITEQMTTTLLPAAHDISQVIEKIDRNRNKDPQ